MKKAVIFDWAGTTVDYGCFAPVQAFCKVFTDMGIVPTMEEVRAPMGMLKWDHINTMLHMPRIHDAFVALKGRAPEKEDVDALFAGFVPALFAVLESHSQVKPYVLETVAKLREQGIVIGSTTGYTDDMMEVVVRCAAQQGYAPDFWFSPDATAGVGRPYPFMIYRNLEALKVQAVSQVIKVGDTVSDILEGKNAGVFTLGVLEGSSVIGLTQEEFEALSSQAQQELLQTATQTYLDAGADGVIRDIRGVLAYL